MQESDMRSAIPIALAYYLSNRMTKDFGRLKEKIDSGTIKNDNSLSSKIDDVNSLEKSFELLKSKAGNFSNA